jgi:hypothetical protein
VIEPRPALGDSSRLSAAAAGTFEVSMHLVLTCLAFLMVLGIALSGPMVPMAGLGGPMLPMFRGTAPSMMAADPSTGGAVVRSPIEHGGHTHRVVRETTRTK